jgi:hypothetical protein
MRKIPFTGKTKNLEKMVQFLIPFPVFKTYDPKVLSIMIFDSNRAIKLKIVCLS